MCSNYKLRECIDAHDNDVKSLQTLPKNHGILSASRDLSVRFWKEENKHFQQQKQYLFHKSYISFVHYMKPSVQYPDGIIFSSGYDKVIKGYFLNSDTAQFSLSGHTNTVTSISSDENGNLISGSMDSTAILWDLSSSSTKNKFKGHKHGIWSVIILDSLHKYFLTASADNEIFLWDMTRENYSKKFIGHTDCVRGLVELSHTKQFLSCSNDSTIRLWSLNTESCIRVFHGHTSFIYSVIKISDDRFVSCGEDSLVCVWGLNNTSEPLQTIALKAQSVWCVAVLNNGDIVAGSSDGIIRIFSEDPKLQNGIEIEPKINKDVLDDKIMKSLPSVGIERLSLPGEHDKQVLKVSDEGNDILYEWSSNQDLWVKKKMLGSSAVASAKKTHDYVFSIDIKDGEPPLKLHYNLGQDPWLAAKQFLDDNDLSPMFLDQVANFIITNSNQQVTTSTQQQPFTDPFTGTSRYVPSGPPDASDSAKQFPHMSYFRYDQINAQGLLKKIQEVTLPSGLPDDIRKSIENIHNLSTDQSISLCKWVLEELTNWPDDQLFPLIDVLRMLVRDSACNSLCFTNNEYLTKLLARTILQSSSHFSKGNTLTIIKLMVNAFIQQPGEKLMNSMYKQITEALNNVLKFNSDKTILIAIASWFLNMSVFINIRHEEYKRSEILDMCFNSLKVFELNNCPEAVHRVLVTIGTLVCNIDSFTFRETLTMNVFEKINKFSKTFNDELKWGNDTKICSQQLGLLISSLDFLSF